MSKKLVILTIPGIGSHQPGYSEELIRKIDKFSIGTALESNYTLIETIPFSVTEIDKNQQALYRRMISDNELGGLLSLRKFVLEAFGDAVTFEQGSCDSDSNYHKIHHYLRNQIEDANQLINTYSDAKLVIIAASMGVHILSTYIWDADHSKGIFSKNGANELQNLKNLSCLFSIGCNIPLFISGKKEHEVVPFEPRNEMFKWDNFYDKDDVLGWPLSPINSHYDKLVNDYQINTGQYIGSHLRYWKNKDFTELLVKRLIQLIQTN